MMSERPMSQRSASPTGAAHHHSGEEMIMNTHHYIVCRTEHGACSGPGHGIAYPDSVEVMAASRTETGAKRAQKKLGGFIRRVEGPHRKYAQNEPL